MYYTKINKYETISAGKNLKCGKMALSFGKISECFDFIASCALFVVGVAIMKMGSGCVVFVIVR